MLCMDAFDKIYQDPGSELNLVAHIPTRDIFTFCFFWVKVNTQGLPEYT